MAEAKYIDWQIMMNDPWYKHPFKIVPIGYGVVLVLYWIGLWVVSFSSLHAIYVLGKKYEPERHWTENVTRSSSVRDILDEADYILFIRGVNEYGDDVDQMWYVGKVDFNSVNIGDDIKDSGAMKHWQYETQNIVLRRYNPE